MKAALAFACLTFATPALALNPNPPSIPKVERIDLLTNCTRSGEVGKTHAIITIRCDSRFEGTNVEISTLTFRKVNGKWVND